jgi:AraC-like DNA-binding protein
VAETVPIHVVQRLMLAGRRRGLDVENLLFKAGIPAEVANGARARVTSEQLATLARVLWDVTDDEMWGLGPHLPRGSLLFVLQSAIHARDLRGVLQRLELAGRVIPAWPRADITIGPETTKVAVDLSDFDDPEHLGTDLVLGIMHRIPGWLIGRRIALRSVEMTFPAPGHATAYLKTFGAMPVFGASATALSFDSDLLGSPVVRTEADLLGYLREAPLDFFATRDYGSTAADRVRPLLEQGVSGDWPSPDAIAARLNMSAQHLRRLLRDEGTSMTEIKEEVLRDAAIASLSATDEPVDELAARLGFSEASAFRRAFRRWTGSSPGSYRFGSEGSADTDS